MTHDDSSAPNLSPEAPELIIPSQAFDPDGFDVESPENSFNKLLAALTYYEDVIDGVDWSLLDRIMQKGGEKVDALAYVRGHLESRIHYTDARAAEWAAASKSAKAGLAEFDRRVKYAMEKNGFSEFLGKDYRVRLKPSAYCDLEERAIDCNSLHKLHYEEFVTAEYKWSLAKLTAALKLAPDDPLRLKAEKVASIKTRLKPVIEIVRENEKKKEKKK